MEDYTNCKGFNLYEINKEFKQVLSKHAEDSEVIGPSREEWLNVCEYHNDTSDADDANILNNYWACIMNAYDEMCERHQGLRDAFGWSAGAEFSPFENNDWDVFIGDGEMIED